MCAPLPPPLPGEYRRLLHRPTHTHHSRTLRHWTASPGLRRKLCFRASMIRSLALHVSCPLFPCSPTHSHFLLSSQQQKIKTKIRASPSLPVHTRHLYHHQRPRGPPRCSRRRDPVRPAPTERAFRLALLLGCVTGGVKHEHNILGNILAVAVLELFSFRRRHSQVHPKNHTGQVSIPPNRIRSQRPTSISKQWSESKNLQRMRYVLK